MIPDRDLTPLIITLQPRKSFRTIFVRSEEGIRLSWKYGPHVVLLIDSKVRVDPFPRDVIVIINLDDSAESAFSKQCRLLRFFGRLESVCATHEGSVESLF